MNLVHEGGGYPAAICLDIETYGAYRHNLHGRPLPPQTQMHPVKCMVHDGVGRDDLVQLVSVSWRTPKGIQSRFCRWGVPAERLALRHFVYAATTIEGANLPFDLKMLRAADPYYQYALRPFSKRLLDFSILNYLDSELRPERSLKTVSRLLNTFTYDYVPDFKRGDRFDHPNHPDSLRYVHSDTVNTIETNDHLISTIRQHFPDTDKLSPACLGFYSDLLWTLVMAEESGVAMNHDALESLEAAQKAACENIYQRLLLKYNFPVHGPGSQKAMSSLVNQTVLRLNLENDRRLKRTPTTNAISTGMENLNLLTELVRSRQIDTYAEETQHESTKEDTRQDSLPAPGRPGPVPGRPASEGPPDGSGKQAGVDEPPGVGGLHRGEHGGQVPPPVPESEDGHDPTPHPDPDSSEPQGVRVETLAELVEVFDAIQEYRFRWRLISAYTYPILRHQINKPDEPKYRGSRLINGIVYPNWFPVPTTAKDDAGGSGGTEQGRVTAKQPALQVLPRESKDHHTPDFKTTIRSRFPGGYAVWSDYSQIELRVPALLSGDPLMLKEYHERVDRHIRTAELILGIHDPTERRFRWREWTKTHFKDDHHEASPWRQLGKTINFLILFRGEAEKLRTTAARDMGIILRLDECQQVIDTIRVRYPVFSRWQDSLIETALSNHHLILPITGQSRSFMGSRQVILDTYIPTIVNFPVQTTAANITLSLWSSLQRAVVSHYLETKIHLPLNVYDSLFADVHPDAIDRYLSLLRTFALRPPYFSLLCDRLGRSVPLEMDVKIVGPDGSVTTETIRS